MTQSIASALPSINYFGSQNGQLFTGARSQNGLDRIRSAIAMLGNALRSASYGLRQEVPFERWFFDHGFQKPIVNPIDLIKARLWAVLAIGEGTMRTTIEAVTCVFSLIFAPKERQSHLNALKAQCLGLALSYLAAVLPNTAKAIADNHGQPIVGCSLLEWRWGTLYTGKLEVPLWRCDWTQYPAIDLQHYSVRQI